MPTSSLSATAHHPSRIRLTPDLMLRVGFAGKRDLDAAPSETTRHPRLDVPSNIGWRPVEISPLDEATNERPVPAIAKFYSRKRPTPRLIHGLCEGGDCIAAGVLEDLAMPALEKTANSHFPLRQPFVAHHAKNGVLSTSSDQPYPAGKAVARPPAQIRMVFL